MNFFKKKKVESAETYQIAFCDTPELSSKFGNDWEVFSSYDEAIYRIVSKANGWGRNIVAQQGDSFQIHGGSWLVVEKIS